MPPAVTPGGRTRLGFALLALLLAALCVRIGFWQWHRGVERELQGQGFQRGAQALVSLAAAPLASVPLYQRVSLEGVLDGAHQFLLDNRSYQGRPGYEVLTPLRRAGATTLLVDRGWVPFSGSRARLPPVGLAAAASVTLSGRVALLPSPGLALGHGAPAGEWPKVTAFPTMDELAAALGEALEPRILWLDAQSPQGYVRDWQLPGMSALRHFSYAIQWWTFAALSLLVWALMALRSRRGARR
jgi:surfeit locus 1 family protein